MSRNRFEEINQHLVLRSDDPPIHYQDKFWEICNLIFEWNKNMEVNFSLCCLV